MENRFQEVSDRSIPLNEPKKNSNKKLTVAAAGLAAASIAGIGQTYSSDPLSLPSYILNFSTDFDCTQLPSGILQEVETDLTSPDPKKLKKMWLNLLKADKAEDYEKVDQIIERIDIYKRNMAEKYGITLLDPEPLVQSINESSSISEIWSNINNFTQTFGISFEVPNGPDFKDIFMDLELVSEDELNLEDLKFYSNLFVRTLADIPLEVLQLSGIKRIVLAKSLSASSKNDENLTESTSDLTEPAKPNRIGMFNQLNNTVYLSTSGNGGLLSYNIGYVLRHEIGHGIDAATCGDFGSTRDSEFEALNPEGFSYGSQREDLSIIVNRVPYGSTNLIEDKATIYEDFLSGYPDFDSLSPVLQRKVLLLTARLEANITGITDYLRSVSLFETNPPLLDLS